MTITEQEKQALLARLEKAREIRKQQLLDKKNGVKTTKKNDVVAENQETETAPDATNEEEKKQIEEKPKMDEIPRVSPAEIVEKEKEKKKDKKKQDLYMKIKIYNNDKPNKKKVKKILKSIESSSDEEDDEPEITVPEPVVAIDPRILEYERRQQEEQKKKDWLRKQAQMFFS